MDEDEESAQIEMHQLKRNRQGVEQRKEKKEVEIEAEEDGKR